MSGRTAVFTLLSGVLLAAGSAAAGDPPAKAEEREIRVFVSDDKGTFLDGAAG